MRGLSPEARRSVQWATLASGGLVAHQVAGKSTRDALFLSNYDVTLLPVMMMVGAALAALAVVVLSRLLARHPPARAVPLVIGISTVFLLAEWALSLTAPRLAALAVYIHMAVFGNTLVSGFWSVVNEAFDPWTARRVVGRVGLGAGVGGILGGALAWGVSRAIPVPATLLVMAALTLVSLVGVANTSAVPAAPHRSGGDAGTSGLRLVRRTPYLASLAVIVGLSAATEAMLDYALGAEAKAAFASHPEALMSFFALYHTAVGIVGLLVQVGFTRPALETLGLAGSVALKPLSFTLGGVLGALAPRLWTAALVRGVPAMLHNSLFRSGYELLYTPLPEHVKRPTKAILDVGIDKAGTFAGSAVALGLVATAPDLTSRLLYGLAAAIGLAIIAVCRGVHRGYIAALEQSLRSGAVQLDSAEVLDSTTRFTMAATNLTLQRDSLLAQVRSLRGDSEEAPAPSGALDPVAQAVSDLRSGSASRARAVLESELRPELVAHAIPLLERNELFLDALRALRAAAPRATGTLVDALLDPAQPRAVRRRLPRVLKTCVTPRAVEGLLRALDAERLEVRYECGVALSRIGAQDPKLRPPMERIWQLVGDELARDVGDRESHRRRRLEHVFNLLSLVLEREPLRIAYWALQSRESIRGTALEYLENVLPERIRVQLLPMVGAAALPARAPQRLRDSGDIAKELLRSSQTSLVLRDKLRLEDSEKDEDTDVDT